MDIKRRRLRPADVVLVEHYPLGIEVAAAALPGWSRERIQRRATRLGLRPAWRARGWSDIELASLRTRYPLVGEKGVARELGRPLSQVRRQAIADGLVGADPRLRPLDDQERAFVAEHYPSQGIQWCAESLTRRASVIREEVESAGLVSERPTTERARQRAIRQRKAGQKPLLLWLSPADQSALGEAAGGRPVSQVALEALRRGLGR